MKNNKYNYDEVYANYDYKHFFNCMEDGNIPSNCNPVPVDYVAEWFRDNVGCYIDGDKDPIIELAKDLVKSGCNTLIYNGDIIARSVNAEDYADEIRYYIIKDPDDYDYEDDYDNYDYENDYDEDDDYEEDEYDEDNDDEDDDDYDEDDDEECDDPYYDEDEDIEEYYENRLDDCLKW